MKGREKENAPSSVVESGGEAAGEIPPLASGGKSRLFQFYGAGAGALGTASSSWATVLARWIAERARCHSSESDG